MKEGMAHETTVLGPRLTGMARHKEILAARKYYKQASNSTLLFCAHLRRLQEGEAHLDPTDPYASFSEFVIGKEIAPDLTKAAIERFSWQGAPLLVLEREGLLNLVATWKMPIGTTGARALAKILTQQGEEAVLETFNLARSLKPGPVSDVTVARAQRELNPPKQKTLTAATKEQIEQAAATPEAYVSPEDEPYDPAQLPEELEPMRYTLDELSADADADPASWAALNVEIKARAQREMKRIRQRLDQLDEALGADAVPPRD
jgi:hypothetical protein